MGILGYAQNASRRPYTLNYMLADHVDAGAQMPDDLWARSGCGPDDMKAAQLYDGFSPTVLYWLEALRFCDKGDALDFIQDGRIERSGTLPVNTFGGSLSEGRLHGMGHIIEAVKQLQGRAGPRQLADPTRIVVTTGSPLLRGAGLVLGTL